MTHISDIISTPVISIFESENVGIIYNIMLDYKQKKIKYALILDEKEDLLKIIKFKDLYKIGKECAFIKNTSIIEIPQNFEKDLKNCINPINTKVFSLNGNYLGLCKDLNFDKNLKLNQLFLDNGTSIDSTSIINIGKNIILINDKKVKLSTFKPKQNILKDNIEIQKVEILKNIEPKENSKTSKIITDYRFLIGRILNKDVTAINGEIIAKNGSSITKDIINKASYYGKLIEITRHSK